MISLIKLYENNYNEIEKYLLDNIHNNGVTSLEKSSLGVFFKTFSSLQMLFITDENYLQNSPSFSKLSQDTTHIGRNRSALFKSKIFNENNEYISSPYLCSATKKNIITIIKKVDNRYLVMDFNLAELLEELGYTTHPLFFIKTNKFIYATIGYGSSILSFILTTYSFASFGSYILYNGDLIEITFKAIISLTLGLAVFDLGKNLIEHEVVFKENNSHEKSGSKMFIKFLISIITALSIEALMLVLKISLTKDYSDMTYALYLIAGTSLMIISLSIFYKMSKAEN